MFRCFHMYSAGSRPSAAKSGIRTKVTEAAFSVEAEVVELEAGVVPLVKGTR
jgi:hypothetical protein